MVIEESESLPGKIEVVEVAEGSNAEAAGIRVSDVLRACSAQKKDAMTAAEGNIAFNALGVYIESENADSLVMCRRTVAN
jgi:hypothetical protein